MGEKVILVDTEDKVLGEMEKLEAHKKGLLHRAVSVFIINSNNEILLQKRAHSKYHSPGLWTNAACTHPRPNESNYDASIRRLDEEMGINNVKLEKAFDFIYRASLDHQMIEHEYDHVFIGYSDHKPTVNPKEVDDYKYIAIKHILSETNTHPTQYTYWFKHIIERVIKVI